MIYLAAQMVMTLLGTLVMIAAGFDTVEQINEYAMLFLIIAALVCIPIYYRMHQKDQEKAGERTRNIPMDGKDYAALILSGAALAIALNNLISITPLPQLFPGYEDTNEVLFGGGLVLQVLGAGIFGCIVEELSLRGVTYPRMKRYWGKKRAIFFSALVFGVYHMNVVQGVYAFLLGLFFVWVYERYDNLWASILAHMSANLCVILFGASEILTELLTTLTGYCLTTCICLLIFYYGWRWMKQTNPLVELEFVSKEPDSLEKLTKEYKEQEREEN